MRKAVPLIHGVGSRQLAVAKLPAALSQLTMDLSGTNVSDAGLAFLEKLPASLSQLTMNLMRTQVSDAS